jgi:hypothetical protein
MLIRRTWHQPSNTGYQREPPSRHGTFGKNPFSLKALHQRGRPGQTATSGSVVLVMILRDQNIVDLGRGGLLG